MHACADCDCGADPKTEVPSLLQVTCHHQNLPWLLVMPINISNRDTAKAYYAPIAPAGEGIHEVREKTCLKLN